mgnify:CR=1 FL=1
MKTEFLDKYLSKGLQNFIFRGIIFVILLYLVLPFIAKLAVGALGGTINYSINYFYIEFIYLGILVIFLLYSRHKIMRIREYNQSWRQTLLFGYIGLVFYALKIFIKFFSNRIFLEGNIYFVVLLEYTFTVLAAAFIALGVFNLFAFRKFYREITLSVVISFCFFSFAMFLRSSWGIFSSVVGKAVMFLFSITLSNPVLTFNDFTLSVNGFSASIGPPCSGIESIAMFTSIFMLLVLYDFQTVKKKLIAPFLILGLVGMYLMTIIRIYLLFFVGRTNPELAMSLFHTNLGWILFVVYMLAFLYFAYPKMLVKR